MIRFVVFVANYEDKIKGTNICAWKKSNRSNKNKEYSKKTW